MKIELDLPDWCDDKSYLYLMKGVEVVAYKWPKQAWKVKTGRCNKCGKCCPPNQKKSRCEHLKQIGPEYWCSLGADRPWSCCVFIGTEVEGCTEGYK